LKDLILSLDGYVKKGNKTIAQGDHSDRLKLLEMAIKRRITALNLTEIRQPVFSNLGKQRQLFKQFLKIFFLVSAYRRM
jgi:hypothetical protein